MIETVQARLAALRAEQARCLDGIVDHTVRDLVLEPVSSLQVWLAEQLDPGAPVPVNVPRIAPPESAISAAIATPGAPMRQCLPTQPASSIA